MYAVMFRAGENEHGKPRLFVFAIPSGNEGTNRPAVVVDDTEGGAAEGLLAHYAMGLATTWTPDSAIRHALSFLPVTVEVAGTEELLDRVVGRQEGALLSVRGPAGTITGIQATGPDAEAAYAAGNDVPWLSLVPPVSELPC